MFILILKCPKEKANRKINYAPIFDSRITKLKVKHRELPLVTTYIVVDVVFVVVVSSLPMKSFAFVINFINSFLIFGSNTMKFVFYSPEKNTDEKNRD